MNAQAEDLDSLIIEYACPNRAIDNVVRLPLESRGPSKLSVVAVPIRDNWHWKRISVDIGHCPACGLEHSYFIP